MKTIFYIFSVTLLLLGCSKNESENKNVDELSLSSGTRSSYTLYADQLTLPSDEVIRFSARGKWNSKVVAENEETDVTWVEIAKKAGDPMDDYVLRVSFKPNYTEKERSASIQIRCGETSFSIDIVQKKETKEGTFPERKFVNVLIIDAGDHGQLITKVLNNRGLPYSPTSFDKEHGMEIFTKLHEDINVHITESVDDFNPNNIEADIINQSSSVYHWSSAIQNYAQFKTKFKKFPLVISSAGNQSTIFSQQAWDLSKELGGLSWYDHIVPYFTNVMGGITNEAYELSQAGDIGSAHVVRETDNCKDWIVVGWDSGNGNKPGPILKDRWICTYYSFKIGGQKVDGTSFSVPYVVKIAAEIKRRAPHYTNDEIAQLIFTTADDLGEPGCDEIYGHGRMNPVAIFKELTKRGL